MKVALVYDRVNKWGGAERVLLALHELFPSARLFTAVYDSQKANWANVFPSVIPTFLNKITFIRDNHLRSTFAIALPQHVIFGVITRHTLRDLPLGWQLNL